MDIRRNDYILTIRREVDEVSIAVKEYPSLYRDALDLIQYCKSNKLRKFKKVAKKELRVLKRQQKRRKRYLKDLKKLLYYAERYTPGRNE